MVCGPTTSLAMRKTRADCPGGGEIAFAIVLELQEGKAPSAMPDKVFF